MNYPLKSFISAFFIWFLLLFILGKNFFVIKESPEVSLQIEASSLSYQDHQIQNSTIQSHVQKDLQHDLANSKTNKNLASQKVSAIYNPLPAIPEDLRDEAFNSSATVRFYISAAGEVEKVELIKPCANPQLNRLLLKSLQQWKFSPADVSSTLDISINFEVK